MRVVCVAVLIAGLAVAAGCARKPFDGPTVDAFNGRLTHDGKPVSFPEGEDVTLQLFHEKGQSFGVPINSDGSFKIGWMPIGKYSATLMRQNKREKGPPTNRYSVPGGLAIQEGQTEYKIDLGKGWKP
jgi:hypothetical protein